MAEDTGCRVDKYNCSGLRALSRGYLVQSNPPRDDCQIRQSTVAGLDGGTAQLHCLVSNLGNRRLVDFGRRSIEWQNGRMSRCYGHSSAPEEWLLLLWFQS